MKVFNLRKLLSLYLAMAMTVTQVVPFGWAQQADALSVPDEEQVKTVAADDTATTNQPEAVSSKPLDANSTMSTDFLMDTMTVSKTSGQANTEAVQTAAEEVLSEPQAETLEKASEIQIQGEIITLEAGTPENALDATFHDAKQLKEEAARLIQDYLKLEKTPELEITRLSHPMASYEQGQDIDLNTPPTPSSRRGEVLLTRKNEDGSQSSYTLGIEAGRMFLTQITDQDAEGHETHAVYLSYDEDGTLSYRSTTHRTFDSAGNVIEESYESENVNPETHELEKNSSSMTMTTYDDQGRVLSRVSSSSSTYKDANGVVQNSESSNESYSEYDDAGNLVRQEQNWESLLNGAEQSSGFSVTENEYDTAGRHIRAFSSSESNWGGSQSSRWSSEQAFTYDDQGHLVREFTSSKNSSTGWKNESETNVSYKLDDADRVLAKISESKGSSNSANTWTNRVEENFAYDAAGHEVLHKTAYSYNGQSNSESVTKREYWKDAKGNITDQLLSEVVQSLYNGKLNSSQETRNAYSGDGILVSTRIISRYYQYDTGKESSRTESLKFFNRDGKLIKLSNRNFYDGGSGQMILSNRSDQSFSYDLKTGHLRMVRGSEYGSDGRKTSEWVEKYDPAFSPENGLPEQGPIYYYPLASVNMIYPYPYQNSKAGLIERKVTSFLYTGETGLARNVMSVQADRYTLNDKGEPVTQESLLESYDQGKLISSNADVYQITGPLYPSYPPYYRLMDTGGSGGLTGAAVKTSSTEMMTNTTVAGVSNGMMADRSIRSYPFYVQNRRLLKSSQERFENGSLVYAKRLAHEYDEFGVLVRSSAEIEENGTGYRILQEYSSDALGRFARVHRVVSDLKTGEMITDETRTFEFDKAMAGIGRIYPVMYDQAMPAAGSAVTASGKMMLPAYYPYYGNNYAVKAMHVDIRLKGGEHVIARIDYERQNTWDPPVAASVKGLYEDPAGASHDLEGSLENPDEEINLPAESLAKKLIALAKIDHQTNTDAERSIEALMESLDLSTLSRDQIEEIRKAIVIKSVQGPMEWSNGCVGFPTAGPCTMAFVKGYIVTLQLFENEYVFHAGRMHPESRALVMAINRLLKDGYDLKSIVQIKSAYRAAVEISAVADVPVYAQNLASVALEEPVEGISELKTAVSPVPLDPNFSFTFYAAGQHFEFELSSEGRILSMLHLDGQGQLLRQELDGGDVFEFDWKTRAGTHLTPDGQSESFEEITSLKISETSCPANPMMKVRCTGWTVDRAVQEGFEDITTYSLPGIKGRWKMTETFVITGRRAEKTEFIPVDKMEGNLVAQIRNMAGEALELQGMYKFKKIPNCPDCSITYRYVFKAVVGEAHIRLHRAASDPIFYVANMPVPSLLKDSLQAAGGAPEPQEVSMTLPGNGVNGFSGSDYVASVTVNPNIRYIQAPGPLVLNVLSEKAEAFEVIPGQEIYLDRNEPTYYDATRYQPWSFLPLKLPVEHFALELALAHSALFKDVAILSLNLLQQADGQRCEAGRFCGSRQDYSVRYSVNGKEYSAVATMNHESESLGLFYEVGDIKPVESSDPAIKPGIPVEGTLEKGPEGPSTLMHDVYHLRLADGNVVLIDRANAAIREILDGFIGKTVQIAGDIMALEGQQILQPKVLVVGRRAIRFSDNNKPEHFTDAEFFTISSSVCPANDMMGMSCTASAQLPIPEGLTEIHRYVVVTNNGTTITTEEIAIVGKVSEMSPIPVRSINRYYGEDKDLTPMSDIPPEALRVTERALADYVLHRSYLQFKGFFIPEGHEFPLAVVFNYDDGVNREENLIFRLGPGICLAFGPCNNLYGATDVSPEIMAFNPRERPKFYRVTGLENSDAFLGPYMSFQYDEQGRMMSMTSPNGLIVNKFGEANGVWQVLSGRAGDYEYELIRNDKNQITGLRFRHPEKGQVELAIESVDGQFGNKAVRRINGEIVEPGLAISYNGLGLSRGGKFYLGGVVIESLTENHQDRRDRFVPMILESSIEDTIGSLVYLGKPAIRPIHEETLRSISSILEDLQAKAAELAELEGKNKDLEEIYRDLNARLNGTFEPLLYRKLVAIRIHLSVIKQLASLQEGLKSAIVNGDAQAADEILAQFQRLKNPPNSEDAVIYTVESKIRKLEDAAVVTDSSLASEGTETNSTAQNLTILRPEIKKVGIYSIEGAYAELKNLMETARQRTLDLPGLIEDLKGRIDARTKEYRAMEEKILSSYGEVLRKSAFVKIEGSFKEEVFGEFRGHGDVVRLPRHLFWVEEAFYEAVLANGDVLKLNFQNGVFNPRQQGLLDAIQLAMHDGKVEGDNFVIASDSFTKSFNGGFTYHIQGFEHVLGVRTEKQGIVKLLAYSTSQPFAENTVTSFDGEFSTASLTDEMVAASDANRDGVINDADLQRVLAALYQKWSWRSGEEPKGIDVNGDGVFDVHDALVVRAAFDRKLPPVISYPLAGEKEVFEQMKLLKFVSASEDGNETHSYDFFAGGAGEVRINVAADGCFGWSEPNMSCTRPVQMRQLIIKISNAYHPQADTASGGMVGIDLYSVDMDAQGEAVEVTVPAGFHFRLFNLARNMSITGFEEIAALDNAARTKELAAKARETIAGIFSGIEVPAVVNESDFQGIDARLAEIREKVKGILLALKKELDALAPPASPDQPELMVFGGPSEASEVEQFASHAMDELTGKFMGADVRLRNSDGTETVLPLSSSIERLMQELERSGQGRWMAPESYLILPGLTKDIVGEFHPGQDLTLFNIFQFVSFQLAMGPTARDLRDMMIRMAHAYGNDVIQDGKVDPELMRLAIRLGKTAVQDALQKAYEDAASAAGISFFKRPDVKIQKIFMRPLSKDAPPSEFELDIVYNADGGQLLKAHGIVIFRKDGLSAKVDLITPPFREPPATPGDAVLLMLPVEAEPGFNGYNSEGRTFPYVGYGRLLEDHTLSEGGNAMREVSFLSDIAAASKAVSDMVLIRSGAGALNVGGKIKFFIKGDIANLSVVLRDADGKELLVAPVKAGLEYGEVVISIPAGIDVSKIDSISLRHQNGAGIAKRGKVFVKCGIPVQRVIDPIHPVVIQDPYVPGTDFDQTRLTDISGARPESFGRNRQNSAVPGFITLKDGSFRFHLPSQKSEVGVIYTLTPDRQDYTNRDFVIAIGDNGAKSVIEAWFQDKNGNTVKRMLRLGEKLQNFNLKLISGEVEGFDPASVVAWGLSLNGENCRSADRKGEITIALGGQTAAGPVTIGNNKISATALAFLTNLAGQVRRDSKYVTPVITQDAEGNRELTIRYNIKNAPRDEGAFVLKAASGGTLPIDGDGLKLMLTALPPAGVKPSVIKVGLRIKDVTGKQITKILDITPGTAFNEYTVDLKDAPQIDRQKIQELSFEFSRSSDAVNTQGSIKLKLAKEFKLI